MSEDLPAPTSHIQYLHLWGNPRNGEGFCQSAREILSLTGEKFCVPLTGTQKVFFVIEN
jgi:hypothetical protein